MFFTLFFTRFIPRTRRSGRKVRTFRGWTSGIRMIVASRLLPCGCLAGIYKTWRGESIVIVDARGADCPRHHEMDHVLGEEEGAAPAP